MVADGDLATWLESSAGVSPKFLGSVLSVCDEEMIGSVDNLRTLSQANLMATIFKPVIAASIEAALAGTAGSPTPAASTLAEPAAELASTLAEPLMPLSEVKRRLMSVGADTWGTEADLRHRLTVSVMQDKLSTGFSWDSSTAIWAAPALELATAPTLTSVGPTATVAAAPAVVAPPPPAPPPPAAPSAPAAPPAAAADKDTFTISLKTPDGDMSFECPPGMAMLDAADELENAEDFEDLPYACRAGSCSACAGKLVSGTMELSGCGFLTEEQKADGWILTCTAIPTSDCVVETHKEDDMF